MTRRSRTGGRSRKNGRLTRLPSSEFLNWLTCFLRTSKCISATSRHWKSCTSLPISGLQAAQRKRTTFGDPRNHCKTRISAQSPATVPSDGHLRPAPRFSSSTGIRQHYTPHPSPAPPPKKHQRRYLSIPPLDSPPCPRFAIRDWTVVPSQAGPDLRLALDVEVQLQMARVAGAIATGSLATPQESLR